MCTCIYNIYLYMYIYIYISTSSYSPHLLFLLNNYKENNLISEFTFY